MREREHGVSQFAHNCCLSCCQPLLSQEKTAALLWSCSHSVVEQTAPLPYVASLSSHASQFPCLRSPPDSVHEFENVALCCVHSF